MSIKIPKSILDQIKIHSEETYPEECCGLLIGPANGQKRVSEIIRTQNAYPGPRNNRYHIDPIELFKTDRAVAQRGMSINGLYHSHPDYPAHLSAYDLEHSFPWYFYVVVSVLKGKAEEVRSWIPDENRTTSKEEDIEILAEV
jgi:proteasome lid subunit RPN8/RPN11